MARFLIEAHPTQRKDLPLTSVFWLEVFRVVDRCFSGFESPGSVFLGGCEGRGTVLGSETVFWWGGDVVGFPFSLLTLGS